jgi:hypothetical protein
MRTTAHLRTGGIPQYVIIDGPNQRINVEYILYQCDRNIGGKVVEWHEATKQDEEDLAKEPALRRTASFPTWYEMKVPRGWDPASGLSL